MNRKFELRDVGKARDYLLECDPATRQRGTALWKRRGVTQLIEHVRDDSQHVFLAIVRDPQLYRVEMSHDEEFGWATFCSCDGETMCDHGYAALRELLSRSIAPVTGIDEPARAAALPLSAVVKRQLGRELKRPEAEILRRVEMQLHSVRLVGRLTGWDLRVMGFEVNRQSLFPSAELPWIPRSALELLHLVIWMMTEHGLAIPLFLQELPPEPELTTRIAQARSASRSKHGRTSGGICPPVASPAA